MTERLKKYSLFQTVEDLKALLRALGIHVATMDSAQGFHVGRQHLRVHRLASLDQCPSRTVGREAER